MRVLKDNLAKTGAPPGESKEIHRRIKKRVSHLQNEHYRHEAAQININAVNRQIEAVFARADRQETIHRVQSTTACKPELLLKHFSNHFAPPPLPEPPPELTSSPPAFLAGLQRLSEQTQINHEAPTETEVYACLRRMKNRKSSSDCPAEFLKFARDSSEFMTHIMDLIRNVWTTRKTPKDWSRSRLQCLWKGKGSRQDETKYRALSIGSSICKLLINISLNRLRLWYGLQISDLQHGFVDGKGTVDGIFLIKRIQQLAVERRISIYQAFVDLTAAFDHICRSTMWSCIRSRFPENADLPIFDIFESLYAQTSCYYEDADSEFPVLSGVRQGGPEAPWLFGLMFDFCLRCFEEEAALPENNIKFFDYSYRINSQAIPRKDRDPRNVPKASHVPLAWCGYADDLVVNVQSKVHLENSIELLDRIFKRFSLAISVGKTETMINNFKAESATKEYPASIIKLQQTDLVNCQQFKYLGTQIKQDESLTGNAEIEVRVNGAKAKFASLKRVLCNHRVLLTTRMQLLNAHVRSRLLYACQCWTLTLRQMERIDSTYANFLRCMVRGGHARASNGTDDEPDFRYKWTNAKLYQLCKTTTASEFVQKQQRKFLCHLVRLPVTSTRKQLLFTQTPKGFDSKVPLIEQVSKNTNTSNVGMYRLALERKY